jgi:branched-chain amino acid transport system permease protein
VATPTPPGPARPGRPSRPTRGGFGEWWGERSVIERRLGIGAIAVLIGWLLLIAFSSFDLSAVYVAIVFLLLYVPTWDRLPFRIGRVRAGRLVIPVALIVLAVTYPFYFDRLFEVPIFGPFPAVSTGVYMLVYIMMAIGLNVVVGYAGLLDLGYVAFYAIGAYTVAWFASVQFPNHNVHFWAVGVGSNVPGFHISVWFLLVAAGIITAVAGVIIGLPTLRLRGDYLAIVTLGFGEILPQIARNGDDLFGSGFNLTNGPNGITPIDSPGFGSVNYLTGYNSFFTSDRLFYWTALILVLITAFCSWRLRDSRLGRAWIAIREDETAAAAMGVPLMRTKTWAYATGAFFGGVAGAFYASSKSATFPGDFFFNISVFILCMVILGGMGNILGVVLGAAFLAYLDREGLANIGGWLNTHFGPGGSTVQIWSTQIDVPKYEFGIFGIILLVVMLFRPEGLIPSSRRAAEFHEGVADQPLYDVSH